jgi:hypothetical protein
MCFKKEILSHNTVYAIIASYRQQLRIAEPLCLIVESRPHIQSHLVFADTQSPIKKPKELEFCQRSIKTTG